MESGEHDPNDVAGPSTPKVVDYAMIKLPSKKKSQTAKDSKALRLMVNSLLKGELYLYFRRLGFCMTLTMW